MSITTLNLIISKLAILDKILLVIDNAEDLIRSDRNDFKMLLSLILQGVQDIKVIITSRILLRSTEDFREESIIINNLTPQHSAVLFKAMTRLIPQKEINKLLQCKPDFQKYPEEEEKWPYRNFHEHHMFTLLNGNPQAIILISPLLSD